MQTTHTRRYRPAAHPSPTPAQRVLDAHIQAHPIPGLTVTELPLGQADALWRSATAEAEQPGSATLIEYEQLKQQPLAVLSLWGI
jgi:hypothetical protein